MILIKESTTCPKCGKTSYNPNDVKEKYCGHCHVFYIDDPFLFHNGRKSLTLENKIKEKIEKKKEMGALNEKFKKEKEELNKLLEKNEGS